MNSKYSFVKSIVWITQFGLSVVTPLVVSILFALWISDKFSLGKWVIAIGLIMGILGAISGLRASLKSIAIISKQQDSQKDKSKYYNDHK